MNIFGVNKNEIFTDIKNISKFQFVFLFSLILWCLSMPFDNAIYQGSWILINLVFVSHVVYYKNYNTVIEILKKQKIYLVLFVLLCLVMAISNALNTDVLGPKSWKIIVYFVLRFALIFLALCYFIKIYNFSEKFILYSCIIGVCFLASAGLYEIITNYQNIFFYKNSRYGLEGFLRNRNGFGLMMGIGFTIILFYLKNTAFKAVLLSIFALLIIFSFSRSAWVASSAATLFYVAINIKKFKKEYFYFALLFCFGVLVLYYFSDSLQHRFSTLVQGNSSHRFGIWQYSYEMFLKQPFFGWGIDSFRFVPNAPYLTNPNYSAPHNMIMELLYSTGSLGFIAFMGLNLAIFIHLVKTKNTKVIGFFIFAFVVCQFDYGLFNTKELLSYVTVFCFIGLKDRIIA
ncbi:O-antigen ligase family protein [Campylobacter sp. RM9344]|uniref:O-antigen ligase family protein n=1 Tax=Campylobacter californiensis TaxID=1032243 RepID=A0AAW3ZVE1_9BACT|nr:MULTISPECIES: O-antigen ligase family protein [unclassified Campylobacter]MBE2984323.1 O-antigen ligase family protein [Campylobacter sp. RM6883]MBE2985923.1 O-antigen ligase family protein [Campylobacter sp. RM12919]MBE2988124.1 O-antigen ligase family protein [Campylobacter sp. RM12920]MBE2994810.1 O-antigen ligase family protein [Campylobacter sp. RM6913]MBE3029414.1 O-antigen ligase family protein [Campylobacter sp. RM9344]